MARIRPPSGSSIPLPQSLQRSYRQSVTQQEAIRTAQSSQTNQLTGNNEADSIAQLKNQYGQKAGFEIYQYLQYQKELEAIQGKPGMGKKEAQLRLSIATAQRAIKSAGVSQGSAVGKKSGKNSFSQNNNGGINQPLTIGGEAIVGGYSSISGESVFITQSGKEVKQVPASFEKQKFSAETTKFSPQAPKGSLPSGFMDINDTSQFEKFDKPKMSKGPESLYSKEVLSRERSPSRQPVNQPQVFNEYSIFRQKTKPFQETTPLGNFLIRDRAIYRGTEELERRFERGLAITQLRDPSKIEGGQIVGSAGKSFFFGLKAIYDPSRTIGGIAPNAVVLGQTLFRKGKNQYGIEQVYPETENINRISSEFYDYAGTPKGQREIIGNVLGGAIFDAGFTPALSYLARPAVNIVSRTKNIIRGVDVGVVEGTTNYSVVIKGEDKFLLVPDIHGKTPSIPEIGDLPLSELTKQTKVGTGESIRGLTFVRGSLAKAQPGEKFLLREIGSHWRGIREAPFYVSPEATLSKSLSVKTQGGKNILVKDAQRIAVGSKQFAENLVETGYSGYEIGLTKGKNVGVLTESALNEVAGSSNAFEFRRRFFEPTQSAKANLQPSNRFLASTERQYGFQAQGVRLFNARGSTLTRLPKGQGIEFKADIFDVKSIPFTNKNNPFYKSVREFGDTRTGIRPFGFLPEALLDTRKGFGKFAQELYEDVGFGREFKQVDFFTAKVGVPVGRPPKKDFEGPPVYKRLTARAVVENPLTGKILFVKEGRQPFIFPGGGIEPINVPGQGKEGIRVGYPKDFSETAIRELYEETGAVGFLPKKVKGTITSEVRPLLPLVKAQGKSFPVFQFQDINTFYRVKTIPGYSPRGEITKVAEFLPGEVALSPGVGKVEREFIRQNYFNVKSKKPSVAFDLDLTLIDRSGKVLPGGVELLSKLKRKGYDIDLFTHSKRQRAIRLLEQNKIQSYFRNIVSRESYTISRDPSSIKYFERIGVDVLVEDNPKQIVAGLNRGVKVVDVRKAKNLLDVYPDIVSAKKSPSRFLRPEKTIIEQRPISTIEKDFGLGKETDYLYRPRRRINISDYGKVQAYRLPSKAIVDGKSDYYSRITKRSYYSYPRYENKEYYKSNAYYPRLEEKRMIERGRRENYRPVIPMIEYPKEYPREPGHSIYSNYYSPEPPRRNPTYPPAGPNRYPNLYPSLNRSNIALRLRKSDKNTDNQLMAPGFLVGLVKKYKVVSLASRKAFTREEAIAIGASAVNRPIGRTFTLIPTSQYAPVRGIKGPTGILRLSKRSPRFFVEKSKYAISTGLEKGTLRQARRKQISLLNTKNLLGRF